MQCFCPTFGLLFQNIAHIVLEKVAKKIKISKSCCYIKVLAVMVTIQQNFLAVTSPATMINDCWMAVIFSAPPIQVLMFGA